MSAADILTRAAERRLLPTDLGSHEIREQIGEEIRRRSLFVARGTNLQYLGDLAGVLDEYLAGRINDAEGRKRLIDALEELGYSAELGFPGDAPVPPAERGSIRDLAARSRMQLILDTQARMMFGAGQKASGQTPQRAWRQPAWELVRVASRKVPRGYRSGRGGSLVAVAGEDWPSRFVKAGGQLRDGGRMVARKDDPVWAALGSSELFDDGLDVDYPPFAFNSGMGWRGVARRDAVALGVIEEDYEPEGFAAWRLNEQVKIGASKIPPDLLAAARRELRARAEGSALKLAESARMANERYLSRASRVNQVERN